MGVVVGVPDGLVGGETAPELPVVLPVVLFAAPVPVAAGGTRLVVAPDAGPVADDGDVVVLPRTKLLVVFLQNKNG